MREKRRKKDCETGQPRVGEEERERARGSKVERGEKREKEREAEGEKMWKRKY